MSYPAGQKLIITWHPEGDFLGLIVVALPETLSRSGVFHRSYYPPDAVYQHVDWPDISDVYYPVEWMRPLEDPDEVKEEEQEELTV